MLILIAAALIATAQPVSNPMPAAPAAAVSAPTSRRDEIVCKTVIWSGGGAPQRACVTRAQWEERSAQDQQNLARFQLRSYSAAR